MKIIKLTNVQKISGEKIDVFIQGNKIIDKVLDVDETIDCGGLFISAGWIDMHVHAHDKLLPYGDKIDEIGYKQGVCSIVDAGSCGINNIDELYEAEKSAHTNVYKFINISPNGLETTDELTDLALIDVDKIIENWEFLESNKVIGIKVRLSHSVVGNNGIIPLKISQHLRKKLSTKLMVHIGNGPPQIDEVFSELEEGDIVTHIFHGKAENIIKDNEIRDSVKKAILKNIKLDLGFGTSSFDFEVCTMALQLGVKCDTISSDIYRKNREEGPVFSLAECMSKLHHVGYSLADIIACVTAKPAEILNLKYKGNLDVGNDADLTLFAIEKGEYQIEDSMGNIELCTTKIVPKYVYIAGEGYEV